jgi:uracil-DNA glycosylase
MENNKSLEIKKPFKSVINRSWHEIFDEIDKDVWEITEEMYNELVEKKTNIFPIYKNIFNFTNIVIPDEIKVCIIGQDPYHGIYKDLETNIFYPEAMGLSFSVPKKCHIPSSLQNIYKNLNKFNHLIFEPVHGDLTYWGFQGVLMLNSALTVEKGKPNSCQTMWSFFTDELLNIISTKYSGIVFLLWGKHAHLKQLNGVIKNQSSHKFIISSHPSGFSANSPYREFKSFMDTDHFGLTNKYLKELGKNQIDWQIV